MAWTPISNAIIQYSKEASGTSASGYYLKFYEAGTGTPFSMASASDGSGLLAKCALDSIGYPINGSGDIFIPYVNQDYRIVLYTNSADADANTFANAVFDVDDVPQQVIGNTELFVEFADLAATRGSLLSTIVNSTSIKVNESYTISDRGYGTFDVVLASGVTPNTFNIVQCVGVPTLALVLRLKSSSRLNAIEFGADKTGIADTAPLIELMLDLLPDSGGEIDFGDAGDFYFATTVDMLNNTKAVTFKGSHVPFILDGVGEGTRLFTDQNIPVFKVYVSAAPNRNGGIRWHGLFVDGPASVSTNTLSRGIEIVNDISVFQGFFHIESCTIKNAYYGVYTSGTDYGSGWITIKDCQIQLNYWGAWLTGNVIRVIDSAIYQNDQSAADNILNASGVGGNCRIKSHGVFVSGSDFEVGTVGLVLDNCQGGSVQGNYFENNNRVGLLCTSSVGVAIKGNYFHPASSMHIVASQRVDVRGNRINKDTFFARENVAFTRDIEPAWLSTDNKTASFQRVELIPTNDLNAYTPAPYISGLETVVTGKFQPDVVASPFGSCTTTLVTTENNELSHYSTETVKTAAGGAASYNSGSSINDDFMTVSSVIKGATIRFSILNSTGTIISLPLLTNANEFFLLIYQVQLGSSAGGTSTSIRFEPNDGSATGTCWTSGVISRRSQARLVPPRLDF